MLAGSTTGLQGLGSRLWRYINWYYDAIPEVSQGHGSIIRFRV